jgi:dihydrofolate reductase
MKLRTNTNVSVDGVMQGLGGPEEDRSGGFERGGWAMPYFDSETAALIGQVYQRAEAFLFGRRTYETFAGSWGTGSWGANQGDNPIFLQAQFPKRALLTLLGDEGSKPGEADHLALRVVGLYQPVTVEKDIIPRPSTISFCS